MWKHRCYLRHYECVQTPFLHINWLAMLGEFVVAARERTPIHCLWVVSVTICNSAFVWNGLKSDSAFQDVEEMLGISSACNLESKKPCLGLFFRYRFFGFNAISAQWSQGYLCQMSVSRASITPEGTRRQGSVVLSKLKENHGLLGFLPFQALPCIATLGDHWKLGNTPKKRQCLPLWSGKFSKKSWERAIDPLVVGSMVSLWPKHSRDNWVYLRQCTHGIHCVL